MRVYQIERNLSDLTCIHLFYTGQGTLYQPRLSVSKYKSYLATYKLNNTQISGSSFPMDWISIRWHTRSPSQYKDVVLPV